jgi:hypothetical protein
LNVGFAEGFDEANQIQVTAKNGSPRGLGKPYIEKEAALNRDVHAVSAVAGIT